MTAEIAVLNRNAVALAADSAVTLQLPEGPKIYHTNKLFALSKYHPVGIMLYGNAEFMRVPWETIIKRFRWQLGKRGFDRLPAYADNFLSFVERNSSIFPRAQQNASCYALAHAWSQRLKIRLKKRVEDRLKSGQPVSVAEVTRILNSLVREDTDHLRMHKKLPRFRKMRASFILGRYRKTIRRAMQDELQQLTRTVPIRRLETACVLAIVRNLYWHGESGIVIAGFGEKEIFPSLRCYRVDSIIAGRLRVMEEQGKRCDINNNTGESAALIAFAQSEMVSLFMNGIDDDYADFVRGFVANTLLQGYPSVIPKLLGSKVPGPNKKKILSMLQRVGRKLTEKLDKLLSEYARMMHSDPIVEIVNHLPTLELAGMAEALVNLTSFKRHITRQAETVGGPIDVAVISRGDGFIWIKRKHYFTKELNPHFLANYYR
jgi:hypothetical protein